MAKDSKSKQTHVGFSISILVQSQDECMQIKSHILHIFPIEIWLQEGSVHMRDCRGLGIALKLFGKFNLEIQRVVLQILYRR